MMETSRRAKAALRRSRRRDRSNRRRSRRRRSSTLRALTSGALALPGLAGSAAADAPSGRYIADYRASYYKEDDLPSSKVTPGGETSRYEVTSHQFRVAGPVADRIDLGLDIVYESMSGATPWYVVPDTNGDPLQVMTGATVEDQRTDASLRGSYYFDNAKATLSAGVSVENDYLAVNGDVQGETHLNDGATTLSSGFGFSVDRIEPTDADLFPLRPDEENKQSYSLFAGLAQIINRNSALQSTLNYQVSTGYLSDPYKQALVAGTPLADSRPGLRNQVTWLTRYRHHVDEVNGTLHADYRFYFDDWEITSHTLEVAWYQSLWNTIRLTPSFRYYSQSQAGFYAPYYSNARSDGYYSSDYRLSPYGALSWRVKAETFFRSWNLDWKAIVSFERYVSSGDFALGKVSVENPGLVSYNVFSLGLTGRF